jgi:hypothetical protein
VIGAPGAPRLAGAQLSLQTATGGSNTSSASSDSGGRDNRIAVCHWEPTQGMLVVFVQPSEVSKREKDGDYRVPLLGGCGPTRPDR